jgi:4'-phosphopantetheinyl transferase
VERDHEPARPGRLPAAPEPTWCAWLMCDAAQVPSDDDWLTPSERAHLAALRIQRRRAEWRLGRWTAKLAVALVDGRGGLARDRIAIIATERGAPLALIDSTPARCAISISHAAGRALCVVGPSALALGCDLERVEPRSDAFVTDYFTAAERSVVARAAPHERPGLATLIWSAKEAALKALREGLRLDTREVEVTPASGASMQGWCPLVTTHAPSARRFDGWWRREGDLVATVAGDAPLGPPQALDARATP